ncbi:hypothetical protein P3T76_001228 [Phytophthora citrophthora]|uniref:DNA recombination and repair protein Rad51-like C-terminal domain-containing protein n=1 Tax=Phytophthora citrophthora TaxID=4793 RepID=A0AAD9GZQ3_9STRA|nr:hypothetical protein P3T76_001228 [Phytophthora citrophthora]
MQRLQLDETALDLFARRPSRSFSTGLGFIDAATKKADGKEAGIRPRQVVELCGARDTPKTQVLEHVVASFLTKSCTTSDQRPKERVFIFDHEGEVSAARLTALVTNKLTGSKRKNEVEEALAQVQTCYCRDSFQWLATLNHIHFQLLEATPGRMAMEGTNVLVVVVLLIALLLVFNCVGSFHAIDKMTTKSVGDGLALSEQVFILLKQFIRHHSPIVFVSKETTSNSRMGWEHAEYLPSSWTSQVSKRILMRKPLPPRLSLEGQNLKKKGGFDYRSSDTCTQFEAKCIVAGERWVVLFGLLDWQAVKLMWAL